MQVACPACAASYQVPDALIGEGRQMRCVRCGDTWFALPSGTEPMPVAVAEPPPAPDAAAPAAAASAEPAAAPPVALVAEAPLPGPPPRQGLRPLLLMAWLASLTIWAGGLYALWSGRAILGELWPPLARLTALLGPA